MRPRWASFDEHDRAVFRAVSVFLAGRLEERAAVQWALQLKPGDAVKRLALLEQLDSMDGLKISEPWRSAWRLIEESWGSPPIQPRHSTEAFSLRNRISSGERSGALIKAIVRLVTPSLGVKAYSDLDLQFLKLTKRPKNIEDLFVTQLISGDIVDPDVLLLNTLADLAFLESLVLALDAAVTAGIDVARRMNWDSNHQLWRLGQLYRVYYVPKYERAADEHEPDEFHRGIAPAVKLLHSVILRLAEISISNAVAIVRKWELTNSPIQLRLWSSFARDARFASAGEVATRLLSLSDEPFWSTSEFPEIAELRAKRFSQFASQEQAELLSRLRKSPPRNLWPKKADAERVAIARKYAAVLELRRIEAAGTILTEQDQSWLDTTIDDFPELVGTVQLDEGFIKSPKAEFVSPNPDNRFDLLADEERLKALDTALSSARIAWDDDPAERASDWIREPGNAALLLSDFESLTDAGSFFPRVWERFGWVHTPIMNQNIDTAAADSAQECGRVLSLLTSLPEATIRQAINGISHWLSSWEKQVVWLPQGLDVWLKLWPIAVDVTNAEQPDDIREQLNTTGRSSTNQEPMDLDTLNTPAGKLVGIFLSSCPTMAPGDQPFGGENAQRSMRNAIEAALGPTGSIVKYRLIEHMPYFLLADREWTLSNLVRPLKSDNSGMLWRAVARQRLSFDVMALLGEEMANRAIDPCLGRDTRRSLVFRIVVDCLHAFKDNRESSVSHVHIQQMIRSLDDEVRTEGVEAVQQFVRDVANPEDVQRTPEHLFLAAAAPFLQQVWPQERSLVTPAISRALADLPATAHGMFADAVGIIERFLVPFDCWSMLDFGLYGDDGEQAKLSIIDNVEKAAAFLHLLDLTIGTAEGAVVPSDLADALDQIRKVAPNLAANRVCRRLATAARR